MRQYYDVYCLLESPDVQAFIGTPEYNAHKEKRFPKQDLEIPIHRNEAFLLNAKEVREDFKARYKTTAALYYQGQPEFDELLNRIKKYLKKSL